MKHITENITRYLKRLFKYGATPQTGTRSDPAHIRSRRRSSCAIALAACMACLLVPNAYADEYIINVSSSSDWRTTTDVLVANQWVLGNFNSTDGVAATVPYGNAQTPALNASKMMWNCGADGMTACTFDASGNALGTGPNDTYFAYSFDVLPGASITGGAMGIIADDFFRLFINGQNVLEALLADNVDGDGQPVPIVLDFDTLGPFLQQGTNVIVVGAQDFGGGEYLFISGSFGMEIGTFLIDVSGSSSWRTTTDVLVANQWVLGNFNNNDGVAATAPYGNAQTTTLNTSRMMWNCGADGMTGCTFDASGNALGTGPNDAYFAYSFNVHPASSVTNGAIGIIADDFYRIFINGEEVHNAFLTDNLNANGQPVPVILDFATLSPYFKTGTNLIVVGAQETFGNEYLFISGSVFVEPVDADFDQITDADDNCTSIVNMDQRDTNGDGFGNACDPDLDNNGVVNFLDIVLWAPFFNMPNTGDEDFNGDGLANFLDYALLTGFFLEPPGPSGVAP